MSWSRNMATLRMTITNKGRQSPLLLVCERGQNGGLYNLLNFVANQDRINIMSNNESG